MKELAVVENSKDFLKKVAYNIRYGRKFKKFNIDKSLSEMLIARSDASDEKAIFQILSRSKSKEDFENNIKDYLKLAKGNVYASALLLGNVTGKYVFGDFYYNSIKQLNIDAFSAENNGLLADLKSHFYEYVMNNNKHKNTFAERIESGKTTVKDLSQDISEEKLGENFDKILDGRKEDCFEFEHKTVIEYLMKTIGTYSEEDIKNNFDFILYDINRKSTDSLEDRRKKYMSHSRLSNNQLKKIDEIDTLKARLQGISSNEAKKLLSRLSSIGTSLDENISELEDIYSDYEALYRQDLIDNLYVPQKDVTIIESYQDLKPQLIHKFIRSTGRFRNLEIKKVKEKIISERTDGNDSKDLTADEQERLDRMISKVDADLDQYKVNYTTDGQGMTYTDSSGFDSYHSNTSNQISASVFEGKEFINSSSVGIIGIGFNSETLTSEAIAISSNSYKTTNKGLNNLEYNEEHEFREMSAPFSELIKTNGKSEVIMNRRGMDFDTKASYIFATIDSSNLEQTADIMKQIEEVRKKEGLKVVIYDVNKIRESLEMNKDQGR